MGKSLADIQKEYEEKDGNLDIFEKEIDVIKEALMAIVGELESKNVYKFNKFFIRGGAGLLFLITDRRANEERILKIPRPLDEKLIESVQNEIDLLKELRHISIMRIYDLGDVKLTNQYPSYPFFIMKYLEHSQNIKELIEEEIKLIEQIEEKNDKYEQKRESANSQEKRLEKLMEMVLNKLDLIAKAIQYLHKKNIVHFDIKPDNIMVDKSENNNPLLSDLGYAKNVTKQNSEQVIGFTSPYAHLELIFRLESKESTNRNRAKMILEEKHKLFDIFSFGKTILEILKVIGDKFEDIVGYNYNFMYLHLIACRMLNGNNISDREKEAMPKEERAFKQPEKFYKETWMEFDKYDLKNIQYNDVCNIVFDFEKVLFGKHPILEIPELSISHPQRIQSNYNEPAPFSERISRIINHPMFIRLSHIPQLGLLHTIYPTATHNRFEHSIGTYRNCCLYVKSLYNDPFNPLFKQLVNEKDLKSLMLAALLHDLGHFPLAHEFEEAIKGYIKKSRLKDKVEFLNHERYTLQLLEKKVYDYREFPLTLKEIIEKYWQVDLKDITDILKKPDKTNEQDLKLQMLHSIIDGKIDVDKLDWIQRDSHNCYLKYGDLIDEDRLIRTLSVIIKKEGNKKSLGIGVYERGQTAAESFAFGRYLLYQSLYWHRTARAVRAMLNEAIIPAVLSEHKDLPPIIKDYVPENDHLLSEEILKSYKKQDLVEYAKKLKIKINVKSIKEEILKKILNEHKTVTKITTYKGFYELLDILTEKKLDLSIKDVLDLIKQRTNTIGEILIEMITKRNYYKRIYTIHKDNESIYEIFTKIVRDRREEFQKRLAEELIVKFKLKLAEKKYELKTKGRTIGTLTLSDERVNEVIKCLEKTEILPIICDAPEEILGGDDFLSLIPEPHKLRYNYENRTEIGSNISTIYNEIYRKLMQQSSKGRIFCLPKIRDSLLHLLKPEDIKDCIRKAKDL